MANRDPDNPGDGNNPEDNGTYTTKVVISELLCYAMSNIQRCNGDQIIKAINQYYNLQEIVSAKKILYEIYRDELGEYPKRKTSGNRSEQLAHVEDIIDSLLYLVTKDNRPDLNFAAVNLNRLPRWNPNETDHFAIAEKLVALQARLENIEFVASENKASCIRNRDDISELTKKIDKTTAVSYAQAASNANIDKERMSTQLSVPLARDSRFQGQVQGERQERDYRWPWQQKETQQERLHNRDSREPMQVLLPDQTRVTSLYNLKHQQTHRMKMVLRPTQLKRKDSRSHHMKERKKQEERD